jgi:hypothetical protein
VAFEPFAAKTASNGPCYIPHKLILLYQAKDSSGEEQMLATPYCKNKSQCRNERYLEQEKRVLKLIHGHLLSPGIANILPTAKYLIAKLQSIENCGNF